MTPNSTSEIYISHNTAVTCLRCNTTWQFSSYSEARAYLQEHRRVHRDSVALGEEA